MFIKIYAIGMLIALIIEIVTALRIKKLAAFNLIGPMLSWIWVGWFMVWVTDMMGRQYEDLKDPAICIWRVK